MTASRKLQRAVAIAIRKAEDDFLSLHTETESRSEIIIFVERLSEKLADEFQKDDTHFERQKFLDACWGCAKN